MRRALVHAGTELLRLVRRRETAWAAVVSAALLVLVTILFVDTQTDADAARLFFRRVMDGTIWSLELALLSAFAYVASYLSLKRELDRGSWVLLKQTPVSMASLYLGKGIAVAAVALVLHCYAYALVLPATILPRSGAGALFVRLLETWIFAVGYIPEGLLIASIVATRRRAPYVLLRLASTARIAGLAVVAYVLLDPHIGPRGLDLGTLDLPLFVGPYPRRNLVLRPASPMEAIVAWQLCGAAAMAAFLPRR
ncbi:MAG: ABC transporter permease [Acidobacteriota bacterium]